MKIFIDNNHIASYGGLLSEQQALEQLHAMEIDATLEQISVGFDTLDEIREARAPLLAQADILINKAEDARKDTSALRQYRQALRDVSEHNFDFSTAFNPFPVVPTL